MPARIKVLLSIVVALAAVAGYYFQQWLRMETQSYAALFLGGFAIFSMWIFPEVATKKKSGQK